MASGEFLHFFPTPTFLRMPTAGLDISDDAIRFIGLRRDRGSYLLEKHDCRDVPDGVIQNGTIKDQESLVPLLSEIREANDLTFARVALPEEKSYLYHATVPYVADDDEMRESVAYTIEENVPLSAHEVVFDYDVTAIGSVEEESDVEVVVSVLPADVVNEYLEVITASGFRPLSLMVESQAIAKAVVPRDAAESVAIINISEGTTAVYIVKHGAVHFTSAFSTEGGSVSAPVKMSFVDNELEEGEGEKKGGSSEDESEPEDRLEEGAAEESSGEEVFVEQYGRSIATEVRRVVDYWETHGGDEITRLMLCGEHAGSAPFKQFLAGALDRQVLTANVWVNALSFEEVIPNIPREAALYYAAAIGLALPQHM